MNTWYLRHTLREAFDDDGYGSSSNNSSDSFEFEDDPISNNDQSHGDADPKPSPAAFDYEALARANAAAFAPIADRITPRQPQPQPSAEDFARLTQKYVPDEAFAKALFDPAATDAQRAQALADYTNKLYTHFYKTTGLALNEQLNPLSEKLTRFEQQEIQRVHAKQEKEFIGGLLKARPDLKPYEKLVPLAVSQLKQAGYQPPGNTEAEQVRNARQQVMLLIQSQLRLTNPEFSFGSRADVGQTRQGMPRMAAMAGGGSNGGSRGGAGGGKAPAWQSVLGK